MNTYSQDASYNGDTVIEGIKLHDCVSAVELGASVRSRKLSGTRVSEPVIGAMDQHIARNPENLRRYFDAIGTCFADRIDTALSGGYDSRLMVALLCSNAD